MTKLLRT